MGAFQKKLDYTDAIAEWFLELAETSSASGDLETGLTYIQLAGAVLCRQSRTLSSPRLESALRFVAEKLAERSPSRRRPPPSHGQKPVCLHVIDEALSAGGLTAMAMNWMRSDPTRVHSAALLSQAVPVPEALMQTIHNSGGSLHKADPSDSLLTRAAWLKKLANESADLIVLHISVTDVIAGAAFGVNGGPPLMLVNHAAHIFWTGACIPDRVANCRGSALEETWTDTYRDLRCATVPIPLSNAMEHTGSAADVKTSLGIPANAILILSVGAFFKYSPIDDTDFLATLEGILEQVPEAFLLVAGFHGDSRWNQASERVGARIKTLGVVPGSELAKIYQAADVFVEAFPFGSTTAFLEACLRGLAVVLPPASFPPPSTTDGVALDAILKRAMTLEEYKAEVIGLCRTQSDRQLRGDQVRASVKLHHTADGWRTHLENAVAMLPEQHLVRTKLTPVRTPESIHERWMIFFEKTSSPYEETLEHTVSRALYMGLRPRLTAAAITACRQHHAVRANQTIPLPVLKFLCNRLLPALPLAWAQKTFRLSSFLFRKSLVGRLRRRAGGAKNTRSWYEDYRNAGT
jgi:hypothetical protein